MSQLFLTPPERARKIASSVLQRLNGDETQASLAVALGVSAPTVNRMVNEHLDKFAGILAHLGLKVVPSEFRCVSGDTYEFLTRTHARVMQKAPELIWDVEEGA
jgi:hypothetical protein